jgi:hypothetical protein
LTNSLRGNRRSGHRKKKDEFPDGFVLTALEGWCEDRKQALYVVSSDGVMQSACDENGPLFHLKSIGEFVDLTLRAEEDEADFLTQFFVDNQKPIIEAIMWRLKIGCFIWKMRMVTGRPRSAGWMWVRHQSSALWKTRPS